MISLIILHLNKQVSVTTQDAADSLKGMHCGETEHTVQQNALFPWYVHLIEDNKS